MQTYLNLLKQIKHYGVDRTGRNGKTRALFALQFRHDMGANGTDFPLLTTKEVNFHNIKGELLWFLSGSTNDNDLKKILGKKPEEKTIWSANAEDPQWLDRIKKNFAAYAIEREPGYLGRIYGAQWRHWSCWDGASELDQIAWVIDRLRKDPFDRRLVFTAWRPDELDFMALPPCHALSVQFFATPAAAGKPYGLSLHMVQRSCDMFLGVPYNIASYGLLLSMIAQCVNMVPFQLIITFNDAHIYHDHFPMVDEQLRRVPLRLPTLRLNPNRTEIDDFKMDDIQLEDYQHQPAIKAKMIV